MNQALCSFMACFSAANVLKFQPRTQCHLLQLEIVSFKIRKNCMKILVGKLRIRRQWHCRRRNATTGLLLPKIRGRAGLVYLKTVFLFNVTSVSSDGRYRPCVVLHLATVRDLWTDKLASCLNSRSSQTSDFGGGLWSTRFEYFCVPFQY